MQLIPDYLAHALGYAVFALTLVWGASSGWANRLTPTGVMGVWTIAFLYAVSDEFHQSFVPGRQASVGDVAADSAGAFLGLVIVCLVMKGRWRAAAECSSELRDDLEAVMRVSSTTSTHPHSLLAAFEKVLESRPFLPPIWLKGAHLQTLAASLVKREYLWGWSDSQPQFMDLSDGSRVMAVCIWKCSSAPTLLAVHGMGGSSHSTYMQGLSHKAYREGWNAILLNLYNQNRELCRPKIFHAGVSSDVGEIIEQLIDRNDLREVFLVGASMGGNILLKLLGERGSQFPQQVRAAAVISPLVDLLTSARILEKPSNFLFQHHFVKNFKKRIREQSVELDRFADLDILMNIKTVREYDQFLTAPLSGFRDVSEYYRAASSQPFLKDVRVPTLLLHSRDDPLIPWEPFMLPEVRSNRSLLVGLMSAGGHLGFIERDRQQDMDRRWAENRVIDFFRFSRNLTTERADS